MIQLGTFETENKIKSCRRTLRIQGLFVLGILDELEELAELEEFLFSVTV